MAGHRRPTESATRGDLEPTERRDKLIEFEGVTRVFDDGKKQTVALDGVTFHVRRGEFVSVLGPSGCGKSTLLNMTAGLLRPTTGVVKFGGDPVSAVNTRVGYVTQQETLFPWRNVWKNVAFPLQVQKRDRAEIAERVDKALELVGLEGFERHYPDELSGGMRRRVSLARTIVYEPETILMDEPFGALDAQLRLVLQSELSRIVETTGITVILVTHDAAEAVALSDRVVVLSARPGKVALDRDITLTRPRNVESIHHDPEYADHFDALWSTLRGAGGLGEAL
jgi:NitT/TauT family transport system ATP-binding protein